MMAFLSAGRAARGPGPVFRARRGFRRLAAAFAPVLLAASCASGTTYTDPAQARGAAGWGPYEVKTTTAAMVTNLSDHLSAKGEPIWIAFKPIRNRTSEHIETEMLAQMIKENLIARKMRFVELNLRGEIVREIAIGRTGLVDDSALPIGQLKSPNYFLEGVITDTTNFSDGRKVQYIVVTMTLTAARSGVTEWTRNKEFLKSTRQSSVGW